MRLTRKRLLLGRGLSCYAIRTTIETSAAVIDNRRIVNHRIINVGVANYGVIYIDNSRVIGEISTSPFAADEANAAESPPIVHTAIKAYLGTPVTGVEDI